MNIDTETYINVLKKELDFLSNRYKPLEEGTGHINTAMYVIRSRIEELQDDRESEGKH
jgi:hypothetical protein